MGISENVYIDRKALELIDKLTLYLHDYVEDENILRSRIGEIKGIVSFAKLLKEGDKDDER